MRAARYARIARQHQQKALHYMPPHRTAALPPACGMARQLARWRKRLACPFSSLHHTMAANGSAGRVPFWLSRTDGQFCRDVGKSGTSVSTRLRHVSAGRLSAGWLTHIRGFLGWTVNGGIAAQATSALVARTAAAAGCLPRTWKNLFASSPAPRCISFALRYARARLSRILRTFPAALPAPTFCLRSACCCASAARPLSLEHQRCSLR